MNVLPSDAYKDNYVTWKERQAKVIRPNIECTNGIIHTIDSVMIDEVCSFPLKCSTYPRSAIYLGSPKQSDFW